MVDNPCRGGVRLCLLEVNVHAAQITTWYFPGGTLIVQSGTEDRDHEVGEVGGAFVELEPAHYAMIG
jgi:hypothetical protein